MKKCIYCDENIQDIARKCRFCGEWQDAFTNSGNVSVAENSNFSSRIKTISLRQMFSGRINRGNFWKGTLLCWILLTAFGSIADLFSHLGKEDVSIVIQIFQLCIMVSMVSIFVLMFSLLARRFHDTNRSAKKLIWALPLGTFVPFVSIYVFVILLSKGNPEGNMFGAKEHDNVKMLDSILGLVQ